MIRTLLGAPTINENSSPLKVNISPFLYSFCANTRRFLSFTLSQLVLVKIYTIKSPLKVGAAGEIDGFSTAL